LVYIDFRKGRASCSLFCVRIRVRARAKVSGEEDMILKRILVVNPSSAEADRLARLAQKYGSALSETDPEVAMALLAEGEFAVAVVDVAFAGSTALQAMVHPPTGVLLTGADEDIVARAADKWPAGVDVDACPTSPEEPRELAFLRALGRAVEHARLKTEAIDLRRSLGLQESKVRDVLDEIREIRASSEKSKSASPSRPATSGPRRSARGSKASCGRSTERTTSAAFSTSCPRSGTSSRRRALRSTSWRRTRSSVPT
jgi:hypothetical protein